MKIAIFADIHGKMLLPFKMVDVYQQQYNEKIDLILQCGDMGCFSKESRLDKATIKHARQNRQELGFMDHFIKEDPNIKAFLDRLDIDMICVRGNHEDHQFLDELEAKSAESRYSIDCYNRVFVCKSGIYQRFVAADGEDLDFMGIGRIGDRKERTEKRFIQGYEKRAINRSVATGQPIDLLISHDVSSEMTSPDFGLDELRPVLNRLRPVAHFYGHTGERYKVEKDLNGETDSVKIKELEFNHKGSLEEGCMIILEKTNGVIEGEPAPIEFIKQFYEDTWLQISK